MSRQTRHNSPRMLQTALMIAMGMAASFVLAATSSQAVRGDADALIQITIAHYEKNDFGHALDEFAKAAQRGDRLARFNYAMMLIRGEGTVVRPNEVVKWLCRTADNQITHTRFTYGELFECGELVPCPLEETNKWYERVAAGGYVEAQCALAIGYLTERGVPHGYERALSWYKKTAEGDDMPLQYIVGSHYEHGEPGVVPQDIEQTKKWYDKTTVQGDVGALDKLRELAEKTYRTRHDDPSTVVRRSM